MFTLFFKRACLLALFFAPLFLVERYAYDFELSSEAREVRKCLDQVENPRILVIGDSSLATLRGYGIPEQKKYGIANCALSGSISLEWYLVLKHLFAEGAKPDAIFVSAAFAANYRNDGYRQHFRFMPFFLGPSTARELLDIGFLNWKELPMLTLASFSYSIHLHEILKQRLFWNAFPGFELISKLGISARTPGPSPLDHLAKTPWRMLDQVAEERGIPIYYALASAPKESLSSEEAVKQRLFIRELCREANRHCLEIPSFPDEYYLGLHLGAHLMPEHADEVYGFIDKYVKKHASRD